MPSPIPRWDPWFGSLLGVGPPIPQWRRPSPFSRRVGSHIKPFEACSAFTHVTGCLLAKSPDATLCIEGFGGFVTSTAAPVATGPSDCVAGRAFHPLEIDAVSRRTG